MKTDVYEERDDAKTTVEQDEIMKKMWVAGSPGAEHRALDAFKGNWKAEVKCWMQPGGSPTVSQATSKVTWTMGGRFLEEEFHGEMMGKPFTGRCLFGFDNTKRKYQSVWMDDTNTAMFTSEGTAENGNKVITLEGKANCAATGQRDVPMKQVFRVLGPDKHTLEMFNDGRKSMEITYTRQ